MMPTLSHDDVQLHYQTFGDISRPALLFSNSLGTNYHMWQAQISALQDDYFIICYDTRGHGASSTPQGAYTLAQLGQDVIALLEHLNIEKATFCGISMGGLTGQWLAIYAPERFNHVVICNTAAKIGQQQAWLDRANLVRQQGLKQIASTAASRWFTASFIEHHTDLVQQLSDDLAHGSAEGYANCCEALAYADLRDELEKIQITVTVVAGEQDPITTVADAKFMCSKIANSQLCCLNASHISNVESAQAFNQILRDVMTTH